MKIIWYFFILIGLTITLNSCSLANAPRQGTETYQSGSTKIPVLSELSPTNSSISTPEKKNVQEPVLLTKYIFPYDLLTINDLYFIDENAGSAVGYFMWHDQSLSTTFCCKLAMFNTTDGGANWSKVEIGDITGTLNSIIFIDALTGYAVGREFTNDLTLILHTNDGGKTWIKTNTNQISGILNDIVFVGNSQFWSAGWDSERSQSLLLGSADGVKWIKQEHPSHINARIISINFPSNQVGYATGLIGTDSPMPYLIKTVDGGKNWTEIQASFFAGRFLDIIFLDEDVGYMVGNQDSLHYIYITKDGGKSWLEKELPLKAWSSWLRKNNNRILFFGNCAVSESCENLTGMLEGEEIITFERLNFFGETITGVGNFLNNESFALVTNTETIDGLNPKYETTFYHYILPE